MKPDSIRIGVVGLGTVGAGVVNSLRRNRGVARERCGVDVEIRGVAELDSKRLKAVGLPPRCLNRDYRVLLNDPEIDIIVELIGGTGVALDVVTGAFRKRKHVVTANKALLAKYWRRIMGLAHRNGCAIGFEASVMAGVPVVRSLAKGLAGNKIRSIHGILNGTSNFVLTRMARRGMGFERALDEARKRGLCEADATLDVNGCDAAQKLAILGTIALGKWLPATAVYREGISHVQPIDLAEARDQFGYALRPLAILKSRGGAVEARVHPTFVPIDHPLARIEDEFNAVLIDGDTSGPITLAGKGAGQKTAASGVISDVIDLARAIHRKARDPVIVPPGSSPGRVKVVPRQTVESMFYLRFSVVDRPGVLGFIAGRLGRHNVSIVRCHQRGRAERGSVPVFVITHKAPEGALRKALAEIDAARHIVKRKTVAIRIEE